jgi:hypothetical protein
MHQADHFSHGFYGRQPVVAGCGHIVAIGFKVIKKSQDQMGGKMLDSQRLDFDAKMIRPKGQKKAEGIPIGFDGFPPAALYARKVLMEKLINTR